MSTAVGLRDQPCRLYERREVGTDGFVSAVFVFTAWWWARLDSTTSIVRGVNQHLSQKVDAIAEFSDEAVVPDKGVLKDPDGVMWWIRGINTNRLLRRTIVGLDRITEEDVTTFELYESADTLDGVHLIDPG